MRPKVSKPLRLAPVFALFALVVAAPATAAPSNDDFADARVIDGTTGDLTAHNFDATKELGEPEHAGNAGGRSVWFSWTAPANGHLAFGAAGEFDTLLAVYTGSDVATLTEVASNDDVSTGFEGWHRSEVSFPTASGTTYFVAVDGFEGKQGRFELFWRPSPANDNFAEAMPIGAGHGSTVDSNEGATAEAADPIEFGFGSIWYAWTAPSDGRYKFDTRGTTRDTVLGVYSGSQIEDVQEVAFNDDDFDLGCCHSWVSIEATASEVYYISIALLDRPGMITLNWSPVILGTSGPDDIEGTTDIEEIRGLGGNDTLRGLGGADTLVGGRGSDVLVGGAGSDSLADHIGIDELRGGAESDLLDARDFRGADLLLGGRAQDQCRADRRDIRISC